MLFRSQYHVHGDQRGAGANDAGDYRPQNFCSVLESRNQRFEYKHTANSNVRFKPVATPAFQRLTFSTIAALTGQLKSDTSPSIGEYKMRSYWTVNDRFAQIRLGYLDV